MTATTLTLDDFLLARFAEDEAVARSAGDGGPVVNGRCSELVQEWDRDYGPVVGSISIDSGRVLAECEAKRRIVGLFTEEQTRADIYNRGYDDGDLNDDDLRARAGSNARARGLEEAVLALAAVYSDHPDYDPAWA